LDLPATVSPRDQFLLIVKTAHALEELGFTSGWLYDHFHTYPLVKEESVFEAWTTLTALAMATERLRLGTIVTCNSYRNPALLAKMASVFDVLSNGRLEFGIGAGWYQQEYEGYGYRFDPNPDRIRMLGEAVQIVKELWTSGRCEFEGKYYSLKGALNFPLPVQKPHPPVLIGGGGEKLTLRVVAKYADMFNTGGDLETYRRKLQVLANHCDKVGRNYEDIRKTYMATVSLGREQGEAERKIGELASYFGGLEEFKKKHAVGTPDEVARKLGEFKDLGVSYFILYFRDAHQRRSLELFRDEVMQRL